MIALAVDEKTTVGRPIRGPGVLFCFEQEFPVSSPDHILRIEFVFVSPAFDAEGKLFSIGSPHRIIVVGSVEGEPLVARSRGQVIDPNVRGGIALRCDGEALSIRRNA